MSKLSRLKKRVSLREKRPICVLKVYRRHFILAVAIVALGAFAYGTYFRAFMTLPQGAISVLPDLSLSLAEQRIMIFSPHCDDEVLGAGGLIQRALAGDSVVKVVVVTDCNKRGIGGLRQTETITGLKVLGLGRDNVVFFNFAEESERAGRDLAELDRMKEMFARSINTFRPTVVILPHPRDTHIDHATAGRVGGELLDSRQDDLLVLYYLVHYNFLHYPSSRGRGQDDYLLPPARLISFNEIWHKLMLTEEEVALKEEAVLEHKSQLRRTNPILSRVLLDFIRKNELFMMRAR